MVTRTVLRGLLIIGAATLLFCYVFFDIQRYLTVAFLKDNSEQIALWIGAHYPLACLAYFVAYVLATGLSIPGAATVLTLLGGFAFGLWHGVAFVSLASTTGATLAFLAARYVLREWVEGKLGGYAQKVNRNIEEDGLWYLFMVRISPLVPFFVVNLACGLTRMPARQYFVVSQIGMLPGTIIYVNAGRELARITNLADMLQFSTLIAFTAIGVFPLLAKLAVNQYLKPVIIKGDET